MTAIVDVDWAGRVAPVHADAAMLCAEIAASGKTAAALTCPFDAMPAPVARARAAIPGPKTGE